MIAAVVGNETGAMAVVPVHHLSTSIRTAASFRTHVAAQELLLILECVDFCNQIHNPRDMKVG